MQKSKSSKQ